MQYITFIDYILLPIYLYIFYIIVRKRSVKYTDAELRKYFFTAFFLRMFGSVVYSLMVQYYYGYGDSFTYYAGSNFLTDQVQLDLSNIKYFFAPADEVGKWYHFEINETNLVGYISTASNLFIMKLAALISIVSFNKFLMMSLFFGLFSFAGQWKLFRVFNDINKGKNTKLLAYAVLYTPSIWFWGSGLMKDSVCLGATGFIIAILYKNFIKKKFSLKDILFLIILVYIVFTIKSYIIIILTVSLGTFIFARFMITVKNIVFKSLLIFSFFLLAITIAYFANFEEQIQTLTEESLVQVESFQKNYDATRDEDENSKGTLDQIKQIDPTIEGMILHSPVAIFTCLFRPFLWESRKLIILFASLESTLLLLCTLYLLFVTNLGGFFKIILSNEYVLFSFILSILFALIIGFTTFNFGTMVRYKIILLPFYYFMLVYIYTNYNSKKAVA